MFIRKKKNASGKISVQVIDKSSGKYKVVQTIGSSADTKKIEAYEHEAKAWIKKRAGRIELDFSNEVRLAEQLLDGIQSFTLVGLDLLLGRIFDRIGFNQIPDPIFRYLVIYRLAYPRSKLKTTEYLSRYHQIDWNEDQLYRYMDKLHSQQKDLVQSISYKHTLKVLGGKLSVVFYDVTTLYFEIDQEDDLRKTGFSKEGKHQNPQIVLGLLVSENGYPLAYDIFEGNKFEGHTMLPMVDAFKQKYKLKHLIIVADSGLLSQSNIDQLLANKDEFILGARIKNEPQAIQGKILGLSLENGQYAVIEKQSLKLIITYSKDRARKDLHNREKGLKRLEKQVRSGKLTKSHINKRGYNKYLKLKGELQVVIDRERCKEDARWDGLKGYLTNARLDYDSVLANYQHLWQIEKAFRISKSDLKIRPIFHRLQRRIEAHICLTFVSYKIYKELERLLKEKQTQLSPEKAIEIAKSIFRITLQTPSSKTTVQKTLINTEEQVLLAKTFNF